MTDLVTEAGKLLLAYDRDEPGMEAEMFRVFGSHWMLDNVVAAIEAEAVAAVKARIVAGLKDARTALASIPDPRDPLAIYVHRAAALRIIEEAAEPSEGAS